jgi:hypothetical protein
MSLTSYRAAPPRAKRKSPWDLSRLRNRFSGYAFLRSGFCFGKIPLFASILPKQKGRLVAALAFRLGRVLCREDFRFVLRRCLILLGCASKGSVGFILRFADLAATYSPAS